MIKNDKKVVLHLEPLDTLTPVEEVIDTLNTLVHESKIRYYGFSDVPAWYAARAQTLAECSGREALALQVEYSLVERTIETRARSCRFGTGYGHLPLERAGQRIPRRKVHPRQGRRE
jgi:aryl-alcohol dehydrogenase-like predicted oxidoreductase